MIYPFDIKMNNDKIEINHEKLRVDFQAIPAKSRICTYKIMELRSSGRPPCGGVD